MPSDQWHDFLSVVAMLVLAIVLAVWLIGLSVERERAQTKPRSGQYPPFRNPVLTRRALAKDAPGAIPVADMPGYYWIGWGKPVHGMEWIDIA